MADNREQLTTRCELFDRTLRGGAEQRRPLDEDFVRGFNEFVAEHPNIVVEWENERGQTLLKTLSMYLKHAIDRRFPLTAYRDLVIQTPRVVAEKNEDFVSDDEGCTMLHYVCRFYRTRVDGVDVVSLLAQHNPDAVKEVNAWKVTPLHVACEGRAPLPVIRALVDACPGAVEMVDSGGCTALHLACYHGAPLDAIRHLVAQKPHLCLRESKFGTMPLELAKRGYERDYHHAADDDIVGFMRTATTAAARALLMMKRGVFRFEGPLPREIYDRAAPYGYWAFRYGRLVEVAAVVMALDAGEVAVLFRRDDIRAEFFRRLQS